MVQQSRKQHPLPLPDSNAERPVPPVASRPVWVVPCEDLDEGLQALRSVGFDLLAIGPADEPRWALVQAGADGQPNAVCRLDVAAYRDGRRHPFLEIDPESGSAAADEPSPFLRIVTSSHNPAPANPTGGPENSETPPQPAPTTSSDWVIGRAGMRYRDLLPGRWGGQFIASHIHIPVGGPVPDYVHYHHVDFQLIFCHRGWVRVVYQDQGDPFVLNAGDAILQAPGIRHRVLEASDDLHVIEVSGPAEHATFVEHDLELPNGLDAGRFYGGQHYVHHQTSVAPWRDVAAGVRMQSFELEPATNGRYAASVTELDAGSGIAAPTSAGGDVDFEFHTVLDGSATVRDGTGGAQRRLDTGEALALDDRVAWRLNVVEPTRLLSIARHRS